MKTTAAVLVAGYVFMVSLFSSGVNGQRKICALKGLPLDLPCNVKNPTLSNKWFTVDWNGSMMVHNEISADADGLRVTYMSEETQPLLMFNELRESDTNVYCCGENVELCMQNAIQLNVSDLQVKVIPATETQKVTLMCSTSCPLTENPAAYVWYKNRDFLYEDWSPWYQELISSDEAATYSCAVKGYEELRAPEVSVDSITSTCFNVTYAKGRMCSYDQKSEDEPCSITYPREVHVEMIPMTTPGHVTLTCSTSCPLTEPQTASVWYRNRCKYFESHHLFFRSSSNASFSCAVHGLEHLPSEEVCLSDKSCWIVNYVNRRICALEGSSVDISSEYSHPENQEPTSKFWYKKRSAGGKAIKLTEAAVRMKFRDKKNQHILTIKYLKKTDSADYKFTLQENSEECKWPDLPGVTLIVTGLKVTMHPEVVTDGQRVALTCVSSCPLSADTTYTWYLNSQPLTLQGHQSKHLVLDPVGRQHAGNYSCAVEIGKRNISSAEKTLTVLRIIGMKRLAAAAGAGAALLVIIPIIVFWWIRRKKTSSQTPRLETSPNKDQPNSSPLYENIPAQPTEHHYSGLIFSKNHAQDLYSTIE